MTTLLILLAGCWMAATVAVLYGMATAPLIDAMAGDRWSR